MLIPVFLLGKDIMAIFSWCFYFLYIVGLGIIFCRLPRWTKSKHGVKKIIYWMGCRL